MRGSKSGSPLGGEGDQVIGAKPAYQEVIAASAKRAAVAGRDLGHKFTKTIIRRGLKNNQPTIDGRLGNLTSSLL